MFTSSWVALTIWAIAVHIEMSMPSWLLIRLSLFTSWHRHISPWKICLWGSSRVFSTVSAREEGPTLQLDLLRRSPAFPQRQGRPAAPARRGSWWRWPSHSGPFPPHHRHRARQRCASGYAQNTRVQQKHGRQWHRARDLKLSKSYWGLCLIRRNSSFAILFY